MCSQLAFGEVLHVQFYACVCVGIICEGYVSLILCQRQEEIYLPKLDVTCSHILIYKVLYIN